MASSPPITLSVDKNIATITLSAPAKLNALNGDGYTLLGSLLRQVAAMPGVAITILTGSGRYFSAGADVSSIKTTTSSSTSSPASSSSTVSSPTAEEDDQRLFWLRRFAAGNIDVTRAFFTHPKILIAALNGPAVGLSAALVAHADFVYATPHTFLLTPFTSLGLVAEGGSSYMFVRRMGVAKANEALLLSRRISAQELKECGFVNEIFPAERFDETVRRHVREQFGDHLNMESLIEVKKLIREGMMEGVERAGVVEAMRGLERFAQGIPQKEFEKIARGEKRHKL